MNSRSSFGVGLFITFFALTAGVSDRCTSSSGNPGRCVHSDACPRFKQMLDDPYISRQQYNTLLAASKACVRETELCCVLSDILPSVQLTTIATTTTTTTTITSTTTHCLQDQLTGGGAHSIAYADETSFGAFIAISGHFGHGTKRCVGSLITAEYVLTAAHCVRNAANISVFVNANNISSSQKGQYKGDVAATGVREIILHERYTISKRGYDIALLRLSTPIRVDLRGSPRPICIPSGEQHDEIATVGHTLSSFGWGLNADGVISNRKQWVTLERISLDRCRTCLGYALPGVNITLNQLFICTASITGHDVFSGYSGAPLMYRRNGTWFMVGIVSFGIGATANEFPTVSTNVQQHVGWILQQISQRIPRDKRA
ncbi:chymotrypsinogen A-like [Anopheles aquasalis]|uniref:chymotrypsinogen A-like n=1 Tax=Anopheles aquasalis TaxID=42839 RepID=UPI00215AD57A|nr:chymotrypsinogen A-like [Anopheles aquasalis]